MDFHGVICYWEFVPSESRFETKWKLVESFCIDSDGYCLTKPSTGGGDREEWQKWMNKKIYLREGEDDDFHEDDEELDYDWEPIMGRAVTIWSIEDGVRLLNFNPPEWIKWLSVDFYEKLCKMPDWFSLLEGGHWFYNGTAREVEKHLGRKTFNV